MLFLSPLGGFTLVEGSAISGDGCEHRAGDSEELGGRDVNSFDLLLLEVDLG